MIAKYNSDKTETKRNAIYPSLNTSITFNKTRLIMSFNDTQIIISLSKWNFNQYNRLLIEHGCEFDSWFFLKWPFIYCIILLTGRNEDWSLVTIQTKRKVVLMWRSKGTIPNNKFYLDYILVTGLSHKSFDGHYILLFVSQLAWTWPSKTSFFYAISIE